MAFVYTFLLLILFWVIVYLVNAFLLECKFTSAFYAKILSKNGITINCLQIKWYTVKCNRWFIRLSNFKPKFLKYWFNFGVLIGIFGQLFSLFFLVFTLFDFFRASNNKAVNKKILIPVLPGVNLPNDQTLYYLLALFTCGIFHEFGHAIAASREQVRVNGFGIFFMFIFPGAYVDLCSDHLVIISPLRQLRIFCAGVWHNFILVVIAFLLLKAHPILLNQLFNKIPHVTSVKHNSPLESIIPKNTIIKNVDHCQVLSAYSFYDCLYKIESNNQKNGYCVKTEDIFKSASSLIQNDGYLADCCNSNDTQTNYCFNWKSSKNQKQHYACIPARQYIIRTQSCTKNMDCVNLLKTENLVSSCIFPTSDNHTRLVRIEHNMGEPILYVGSISELIYSVQLEDYLPKHKFIPKFLNYQFQLFLKYIISFSGAIGLLNLVPCFALDGQYILSATLAIYRKKTNTGYNSSLLNGFENSNEEKKPLMYILLMVFGSSLLFLNLFLALISLAYSKLYSFN